jgi:hypothetical protein
MKDGRAEWTPKDGLGEEGEGTNEGIGRGKSQKKKKTLVRRCESATACVSLVAGVKMMGDDVLSTLRLASPLSLSLSTLTFTVPLLLLPLCLFLNFFRSNSPSPTYTGSLKFTLKAALKCMAYLHRPSRLALVNRKSSLPRPLPQAGRSKRACVVQSVYA